MAITKYSVDDYEEMIRLGILTERDRVELIRGEIVPKMAIGPRHSTCVKGFVRRLIAEPARAILGCQDPVRLGDSEPEPDISVVRPPKERILPGIPSPWISSSSSKSPTRRWTTIGPSCCLSTPRPASRNSGLPISGTTAWNCTAALSPTGLTSRNGC